MSVVPHLPKIGPRYSIRIGSAADIDTLVEIDADASTLFVQAGLDLELPADHPFFTAERDRWMRSLVAGQTLVAVATSGRVLGFAASGSHDGAPYLDQLSVRTQFMRIGIGTALLRATETMARGAGGRTLWLTTYGHLSWNRPFYERAGFTLVPAVECGPEMLAVSMFERRWLPAPEQRVVMRKNL